MKLVIRWGRIFDSPIFLAYVALPRILSELWFSLKLVEWYVTSAPTSMSLREAYVIGLKWRFDKATEKLEKFEKEMKG